MKSLILPTLLLLLPSHLPANGGGYRYGTKFTGALAPFQPTGTEHVQIVEEYLDITLGKTAADVSVRYLMQNLTGDPVAVRFGFPVEILDVEGMGILDDDPVEYDRDGEVVKRRGTEKLTAKYCKNYVVTADGKRITFSYQPEPFAGGKIKPFPGSDALGGIQGWMVSELTFEKGQKREITINYRSDYDVAALFVSEDHYQNPATFRYRLSTGGVWGGTIAKGAVTVRTDGIPHHEVTLKKPAGQFRTAGNVWKWEFENLEPTLADDLVIEAIPGWVEFRRAERDDEWFGYIERLGVWSKTHQEFAATASSSLKSNKGITYGPENLTNDDWNPEDEERAHRAWVEGAAGDGIGEFLEITPSDPAPLAGLVIRNGYGKSDDIFAKNSRVKTLTVTLNGKHSFDATLKDNDNFQHVFVSGYSEPVTKIRLTIKDIYPGSKYRDTCISNIELAKRLAKKPEVHGAR